MRALWVAPSQREAACLPPDALVLGGGEPAAVLTARLGADRADIVVIAGVCGGLDPSLGAGGLVLARSVVSADAPALTTPPALLERARAALRGRNLAFATAGLLTADVPVVSVAEKTALWNAHAAAGVDMETYRLASAAATAGVAWLALRAVVDPAGLALPAPLRDWRAEADERALVGRLARRPQDWLAVIRLALALRQARRALGRAARTLDSLLASTDAEILRAPAPELPLLQL